MIPPRFSGILAAFVCCMAEPMSGTAAPPPAEIPIIDCHTHFYDPARPEGVPWPTQGSLLYRTVLPRDFQNLKMSRPVLGTIVVEASKWVEDNAWLLTLAEKDPFILGIVGHLDPLSSSFGSDLTRFSAYPLFRGIRVSQGVLETLLQRAGLRELRMLAERNLTLDVIGGPSTPALVAQAARQVPDLTLVVDHIGSVPLTAAAPPEDWSQGIRAAGACGNVYCKVSALVENAASAGTRPAPTDLNFYRPYLDVVWQAFGSDRVLYASNWPVCELGADYETVQRLAVEYALEKGPDAATKFCSENSQRAYGWKNR
jgi:predicted TIM-barrel fold metal-dependent hydrolase